MSDDDFLPPPLVSLFVDASRLPDDRLDDLLLVDLLLLLLLFILFVSDANVVFNGLVVVVLLEFMTKLSCALFA